jgi:hypothetical protein
VYNILHFAMILEENLMDGLVKTIYEQYVVDINKDDE